MSRPRLRPGCARRGHLWSFPYRPVLSQPGLDFRCCERCSKIEWVGDRMRSLYTARDGMKGRKVW